MESGPKPGNILRVFGILKGNTRVCVAAEPLWGIPFVLYNFYLSLYMRAHGVTDQQIGFLISLGFISAVVFSFFGGIVTDALGRKRTTLIFDLFAWPISILLYMLADRFWMFALATVVGGALRIVMVSWHLLIVEDAGTEERVAAYNLINMINICTGVITPLGGILVRSLGIIAGERILLGFAVVSMTVMIFLRNHYIKETTLGREILAERRRARHFHPRSVFLFYGRIFEALRDEPQRKLVLAATILFSTYVPIGTFSSLYYAPYLTEVLGLSKHVISILGSVSSVVLFLVLAVLAPRIPSGRRLWAMIAGLLIQITSLLLFIIIPRHSLAWALVCAAVFAVGYGLLRPFLDAMLAEVTEGRERAGFYALQNLAISFLSAGVGFISGFLYHRNPVLIYLLSMGILLACASLLIYYGKSRRNTAGRNETSPLSQGI